MPSTHCKNCAQPFQIEGEDERILARFDVPAPMLCSRCRHQRRIAFRNERNLYQRPCDRCKKRIVSVYAEDSPHTVYCNDCFWSDTWSPLEYGKDFDFNRPFFDQFEELFRAAPLLGSSVWNSVNCDYNAFCVYSKDCYLSTRIGNSEGILYSYLAMNSLGCFDCFNIYECTYCYECIDCWNCYNSFFLQLCRDCTDCNFCYDCIGCRNCFGSIGLRSAEYHFFNKKYSKEEYEKLVKEYMTGTFFGMQNLKNQWHEYLLQQPHRAFYTNQSQNAVGDFINQSKDVYYGFDVEKSESVRFSWGVEYGKDVYDGNFIYYGENSYEVISNSKSTNVAFCFAVINNVYDVMYSMHLNNGSHHCFGCVSLKKNEYCILNKQYDKEAFDKLRLQIIDHMRRTGEYGEFFPPRLSSFGYNESIVADYFPLTEEQAVTMGFQWKDEEAQPLQAQAQEPPDAISDATDTVLREAFICTTCGKQYKLVPEELVFYRKNTLPIPHACFRCRHRARLQQRPARALWKRPCAKCGTEIQSSYSLDRPEIVYCEKCYTQAIY